MSRRVNFLVALSLLVFVLLPVVTTQETASPGMPLVILSMLPAFYALAAKKSIFIDRGYLLITLLFFFSAFLSNVASSVVGLDISLVKFFVFALYFVLISSAIFVDNNIVALFRVYIIMSLVLAVLIILSYIYGYPHVESVLYQGRYSIGITGMYKNPNYLTSVINMGYMLVFYKLVHSKDKLIKRLINVSFLVIFLVSMYFSGTRAALLVAFVSTILILLFSSNLKSAGRAIFIILAAVFVLFFYLDVNFLIGNFLGHRETFEDVGRAETWGFALRKVYESPILGYGLLSWEGFPGTSNLMLFLHNIFIELLFSQGFLGFILFCILFFKGVKKIKKEDRSFVYVFMFANAFPLLFQNGYVEANFWRFMILNSVVINYSIYSKGGYPAVIDKI